MDGMYKQSGKEGQSTRKKKQKKIRTNKGLLSEDGRYLESIEKGGRSEDRNHIGKCGGCRTELKRALRT